MNIRQTLIEAWDPHQEAIDNALKKIASIEKPSEADFLWFILFPEDLCGLPVFVFPAERSQEQHDGWDFEDVLSESVPDDVELPEEFTSTPENLELFRDEVARYLEKKWNKVAHFSAQKAFFSMRDDGLFFSLVDGRRVSAWDLEKEF